MAFPAIPGACPAPLPCHKNAAFHGEQDEKAMSGPEVLHVAPGRESQGIAGKAEIMAEDPAAAAALLKRAAPGTAGREPPAPGDSPWRCPEELKWRRIEAPDLKAGHGAGADSAIDSHYCRFLTCRAGSQARQETCGDAGRQPDRNASLPYLPDMVEQYQ